MPDSGHRVPDEDRGMAQPARRRALLLAVGGALLLGRAHIGPSRLSAEPEQPVPPSQQAAESFLDGIPQDGAALGDPDAPVTLVEYADLQCPYCAQWALGTFPTLVRDDVRAGKLRIEFRGLAFIGPDSDTALRAVLAAGRQGRLWDVVELLYGNQGAENSGWVSEELLGQIAAEVPGLDPEQFAADRQLQELDGEIAEAQAQATLAGVHGTPSFELGRTGGHVEPLEVTSLAPDQFRTAIDALLG